MRYYTIPPSATLAKFVRFFWVLEGDGSPYLHRSMADVYAEMVFHYNGQFCELADQKSEVCSLTAIQGPSSQIRRFNIDKSFGIFGVYLYPYSIPVFFNVPATELSNQMPDLSSLLGKEGAVLEERILFAHDNNERVRIITDFLERRVKKNLQRHSMFSSIELIIRSGGSIKVEEIAGQHFVSMRQFERQFKQYSGLTPKLFSRIVRFHAACQHFGSSQKSLTDIAYECGYYDQSHFIHDFKEFSGYHPKSYFSGHAEGTEWKTA